LNLRGLSDRTIALVGEAEMLKSAPPARCRFAVIAANTPCVRRQAAVMYIVFASPDDPRSNTMSTWRHWYHGAVASFI